MVIKSEIIRAWQSRVGQRTAHLNFELFTPGDLEKLYKQYDLVTKYLEENDCLNDKTTLIDFGCGGGLYGKYLYQWEYLLKKYIGVDIADRCITESRLNNMCWMNKNVEVEIIKTDPIELTELNKYKADVFICLNVVRYFPDMEYVNLFFKWLNRSRIDKIIFNFKLGKENGFREKPYKTTTDIGLANQLSLETIVESMSKYKANKIKNISDDCFIFFNRKIRRRKVKDDNTISD